MYKEYLYRYSFDMFHVVFCLCPSSWLYCMIIPYWENNKHETTTFVYLFFLSIKATVVIFCLVCLEQWSGMWWWSRNVCAQVILCNWFVMIALFRGQTLGWTHGSLIKGLYRDRCCFPLDSHKHGFSHKINVV